MPVVEMVSWLADHFPKLTHNDAADIVGVSQQLVTRYMNERERQRGQAMSRRETTPEGQA